MYALNSLYMGTDMWLEELLLNSLRSHFKPRLWAGLLNQRSCGVHSGSVDVLLISIRQFLFQKCARKVFRMMQQVTGVSETSGKNLRTLSLMLQGGTWKNPVALKEAIFWGGTWENYVAAFMGIIFRGYVR